MKTLSPASGILLGGFFAGLGYFITPSVQFVMKGGEWWVNCWSVQRGEEPR